MKTPLAPGVELYKYRLTHRVGSGSFGEVWLARDLALERDVAVKLLDDSLAPIAASLDEARRGNRLDHPNVVKIHYADVVDAGGEKLVVIAMDYHASGSIVSLNNLAGFIAAPTAVAITVDVLKGLDYLHEQHVFHNDIKPSNILRGQRGEARLSDYGISCVASGAGPVPAPSAYHLHQAPETAATGMISAASDIYQVGLTLFRLLYGDDKLREQRKAVGAAAFDQLKAEGRVPDPKGYAPLVDARLKRIISRATAADPTMRYASALEMRRALERVQLQGHWDVDCGGGLFGTSNGYQFTFETPHGARHAMNAFQKNERSGRRTRVTAHCHKGLTAAELEKKKAQFLREVVNGKL
jgi:serine/threonine protein kinase